MRRNPPPKAPRIRRNPPATSDRAGTLACQLDDVDGASAPPDAEGAAAPVALAASPDAGGAAALTALAGWQLAAESGAWAAGAAVARAPEAPEAEAAPSAEAAAGGGGMVRTDAPSEAAAAREAADVSEATSVPSPHGTAPSDVAACTPPRRLLPACDPAPLGTAPDLPGARGCCATLADAPQPPAWLNGTREATATPRVGHNPVAALASAGAAVPHATAPPPVRLARTVCLIPVVSGHVAAEAASRSPPGQTCLPHAIAIDERAKEPVNSEPTPGTAAVPACADIRSWPGSDAAAVQPQGFQRALRVAVMGAATGATRLDPRTRVSTTPLAAAAHVALSSLCDKSAEPRLLPRVRVATRCCSRTDAKVFSCPWACELP